MSAPGPNLAVNTNNLPTLVAVVGEDTLVAADAVGMILPEDVPVPGQTVVTVVAEQHLVLHLSLLAQRHGALDAVTSVLLISPLPGKTIIFMNDTDCGERKGQKVHKMFPGISRET